MSEQTVTIPERNLLVAILRRALFDYIQGSGIERLAARDWLFEDNTFHSFSYRWICIHLGLDAESILSRLKKRNPRTQLAKLAA